MNVTKLYRLSRLAADDCVALQTVHDAAKNGRLRVYRTACGLMLATEQDFAAWLATWRPRHAETLTNS